MLTWVEVALVSLSNVLSEPGEVVVYLRVSGFVIELKTNSVNMFINDHPGNAVCTLSSLFLGFVCSLLRLNMTSISFYYAYVYFKYRFNLKISFMTDIIPAVLRNKDRLMRLMAPVV